jgi:hypothetical protein
MPVNRKVRWWGLDVADEGLAGGVAYEKHRQ